MSLIFEGIRTGNLKTGSQIAFLIVAFEVCFNYSLENREKKRCAARSPSITQLTDLYYCIHVLSCQHGHAKKSSFIM